ncbi:MAG: hypothetical protein O3A63_04305 [Proteobacteria bacterium]|nr:hypothetical protein [Pseudomonadota bacterium]
MEIWKPPYDTFWGSRYAIINDPDGNNVGVHRISQIVQANSAFKFEGTEYEGKEANYI